MKRSAPAVAVAGTLMAGLSIVSIASTATTAEASSARITHYSNSRSTIQVAPCNRSKDSCSITAVLSPGETGPAGSFYMYIQPGYQGIRIGAPKGAVPKPGGKWVDGRAYGLSATYKVVAK